MKRSALSFTAITMIAAFIFATAGLASAQRRNDREVRDALRILSTKLEDFDYGLSDQLRSSSANRDIVNEVSDNVRGLKSRIRDFQRNFDQKRESADDANRIIDAARRIDEFINSNPQNRDIEDDWGSIRSQIERLSANYGITATWSLKDDPQGVIDDQGPYPKGTVVVGLSGTYSLDTGKSESFEDSIGNIDLTADQRQDLKDKLEAPAQIAIDVRGNQVTLATSSASPVTIMADGREKVEQDGRGGSIRLRSTLNGSSLSVSSLGGETDYTVTFTSVDDGRVLKVSRRITTEYLDQTVFAESIYTKTDNTAGLGIEPGNTSVDQNGGYSDNDQGTNPSNGSYPTGGTRQNPNPNRPPTVTGRSGDFVVPNGVVISGTLDNEINTKASQSNDRFRMTVQSPSEFRGATIEGYISGVNRSGRATGRSNITFNFEKITLANGKTYDFAGNVQSIVDQNGKNVKVDAEGTAQGGSQTGQTAKRGGIGAGIGALIGAIAGGGTGAAIGAVIGAGVGAGSVIAQGRGDLQLMKGSTISVQSSSPIRSSQTPPDK